MEFPVSDLNGASPTPTIGDLEPPGSLTAACLTLFGTLAGHTLLETARDTLFLSRLPASQLPWTYLVIAALASSIRRVRGSDADLVGSPGTYDQKHFAGIAGVEHCVAYGPGPLEEAHQPNESCSIDHLVASAQVLALTIVELVG